MTADNVEEVEDVDDVDDVEEKRSGKKTSKRHQLAAAVLLFTVAAVSDRRSSVGARHGVPLLDAGDAAPRPFIRWTFREDFSHGIPRWISFPLPQDVGYDPSLYTTVTVIGHSPVLVRDVTANRAASARWFAARVAVPCHSVFFGSNRLRPGDVPENRRGSAYPGYGGWTALYPSNPSRHRRCRGGAAQRRYRGRLNGRELQIPTAGADRHPGASEVCF